MNWGSSVLLGVLAAGVLTLQTGFAQSKAADQPNQTATQSQTGQEQQAAEKAGPGHEGIQVHGHWVIEVRDPDGTLVTHREFENSLTRSGGDFLVTLLARSWSLGPWLISLQNANQNLVMITDATGTLPLPICGFSWPCVTNLVISATPSGAQPSGWFTLAGTATAPSSASINHVSTGNVPCPGNGAPGTGCGSGAVAWNLLTGTDLSPAISVTSGQNIAVTVTISFS
jgi:hypothetical protein